MMNKTKILSWAFWLILAASSGTLALFAGITLYLGPKLPEVESLRQIKLQTPLRIYSHDGLLIGEFGEKRRSPITIEQVPKEFIDAILAAEDDRFYSHPGVDIKGLLRAASQLLKSGEIQTGGSTITMQVARNFFLTRKQTFSRKFNEILLALQIEKELSKAEILELYTNKIYLGNRAYGIEAAAQVYYGKSISELSLAQLAMIAGLPKAPSAYNPIVNPERALVRRNWILGRMQALGYIDQQRYQTALNEPVTASYHGSKLELQAPYVAEMARKEAVDRLGLAAYTDGFKIYTSVDSRLQARAQQAVRDGLITYDKRHGYRGPEASLITADATDGVNTETDADESSAPLESTAPDAPLPLAEWQEALKSYKEIGNLQAAAVTQVNPNSIDFLMADGTMATIKWENGLSSARPYITENRMGAAPKNAAEVVKVGDVIRVTRAKDNAPETDAAETDAAETDTPEADSTDTEADAESPAAIAAQSQPADDGLVWHLGQVPAAQAALVSLNPDDGGIRALVGGFDFQQSHFNRATQAERQPGSNFKPFIYTTALEHGMTPATIINDAPIVFDDSSLENTWRPENASGKFFGPTRLRQALYKSRNLVSIRVLRSIGIETALQSMSRYGLDRSKMPRDLSLALGSHILTPLQVATGYTVFANGGFRVHPYLVERIDNVDNETVYLARPATVCRECEQADKNRQAAAASGEDSGPDSTTDDRLAELESAMAAELSANFRSESGQPAANLDETDDASEPADEGAETPLPQAERVLSEQVAYLIDDMLRDVIRLGTGRRAKVLNRQDLAGKTGTTNGPTDAWFSGYNRHLVTTAWLGFDKNTNLGRREFGGTSALPIWIDFMETALEGVPEEPRSLPDGLVSVRIDPVSGKRAPADQPNAIFELFPADNLPPYEQSDAPLLNGGSSSDEPLPEELF